jgi:hypothetical protein
LFERFLEFLQVHEMAMILKNFDDKA